MPAHLTDNRAVSSSDRAGFITNGKVGNTMLKKLAIIINPAAGKGQNVFGMSRVVELFCRSGYCVTIYMTEKSGDAAEFAYNCGEEYEILVCCGGDGTLSETINGLMKLKKPPALGHIPLGTTNDFANSMNLTKNLRKAAETILTAKPKAIDIAMFGNKYFTYIAAFGMFADISYTTPQETKNSLGHFAYIVEGISRLGDMPTHHAIIQHDMGILEDDFIFGSVTNSLSVAGLVKLNPDIVSLTDGYFEVVLVKPPKNIGHYQKIIGGLLTQSYDPECVIFLQTSAVAFHFETPIPWTVDGENGGEHKDITIRNLPESLFLLA